MLNDNYWHEVLKILDHFDSSQDDFFCQVWGNKRLCYENGNYTIDDFDKYCAQLACSAHSQEKPLLIVLPDELPHRIPVLFATVLLRHAYYNLNSTRIPQSVIYFGLMASIREHLLKTSCGDYTLSMLFDQINLKKRKDSYLPNSNLPNPLPPVVFSNIPTNPDSIIDTYNPSWCFIDLGNGDRVNWFPLGLAALQQRQIHAIACIQNPLSETIRLCEKEGWQVFRWPHSIIDGCDSTSVEPLILDGDTINLHSKMYKEVNRVLYAASREAEGSIASNSITVIRKYISGLEQLNVPYQFYEAESSSYWGIYSLSNSKETVYQFINSLQTEGNPLGEILYKCYQTLVEIHDQLQSMDEPPLWKVLTNYCMQEISSDSIRILIFSSEERKRLFSLALLAYYGISTEDLNSINVWIVSIRQFNQWQRFREYHHVQEKVDTYDIPPIDRIWYPLFIGIPRNHARYASIFRLDTLTVLLYPHQINSFKYSIEECEQALQEKHPNNLKTLQTFNQDVRSIVNKQEMIDKSQRILTTTPHQWKVEESKKISIPEIKKIFDIEDRVEEIAWLMKEDDYTTLDEKQLREQSSLEDGDKHQTTLTTDKIMNITFIEGFNIQFPQYATVQLVLRTNKGLELEKRERTACSLRPNDIVLYIHGQRRQNLYQLIVSRVHAHPSIALSVNLIQKWQEEISNCVKGSSMDLDKILTNIRHLGSKIETSQAIRLWVDGQVLCPKNPLDLERIAKILEMPFTLQYHKEIARAATRLRGVHIGLSRRLNQWLQQGAVETRPDQINDLIDPELGITFNDFKDALCLLTVKNVKEEQGIFLISDLGQLLKE
ncbi:DrmE family protein [Candidatus Poribacteria bacterium]|nr:DrmE family protein [Candidatus Poribacteria bacterium]